MSENICALVHADGGIGKSWLAQTTPAPRLILDAEGGSRSPWRPDHQGGGTRQRRIKPNAPSDWNPRTEEPPAPGDWDTCHVAVRDYEDVVKAYAWLNSGRHPFRSVIWDSLTEIQSRCRDSIGGEDVMTQQQWQLLLLRMSHLVRQFRDLVFNEINPLDAVLFLAVTKDQDNKRKPSVQGALANALPGYVDLEGYMFISVGEDSTEKRMMLIHPRPPTLTTPGYEAKCRKHELTMKYGPVIVDPDFEDILSTLNSSVIE